MTALGLVALCGALAGEAAGVAAARATATSTNAWPAGSRPGCFHATALAGDEGARPAPEPGIVDPFHVPTSRATELNAEGKVLYRQGRWDEARTRYRAAEAADPGFLAPALNVACSFVRQERFAEALAEVRRLLDRAFVPWGAEALAAADLGALKVSHPGSEGHELAAMVEASRARWASGLSDDVLVLARLRPPLKLEAGNGAGTSHREGDRSPPPPPPGSALVIGLHQEILAWSPRTLRYRQVTAEQGRVLAFARSTDGHGVGYVTAEKLIPAAGGGVDALRGVAIVELDLGTLSPIGRGLVAGDLRRLDIVPLGSGGFAYRIDTGAGATALALAGAHLEPRPLPRSGARAVVTLTARGVATPTAATASFGAPCPGTARDGRARSGSPTVLVQGRGLPAPVPIGGPFGASLAGLPIP